ncbi:unnamed protein product [Prunus brigantina]
MTDTQCNTQLADLPETDLKPVPSARDNLLCSAKDENFQLKAIDFGLSDFAKPGSLSAEDSQSHPPAKASTVWRHCLFYPSHSAMSSEASLDTQHHNPRGDSSRKKPLADAHLQVELERLRASIAKMTKNYEHLRTKNVKLEHNY